MANVQELEYIKFDHREDYTKISLTFPIDEVDTIETYGRNGDIKIQTHNGNRHIFRCSCCIQFCDKGKSIRIG
jgi:hypothetical protein